MPGEIWVTNEKWPPEWWKLKHPPYGQAVQLVIPAHWIGKPMTTLRYLTIYANLSRLPKPPAVGGKR